MRHPAAEGALKEEVAMPKVELHPHALLSLEGPPPGRKSWTWWDVKQPGFGVR
jgi:hypothetical protein